MLRAFATELTEGTAARHRLYSIGSKALEVKQRQVHCKAQQPRFGIVLLKIASAAPARTTLRELPADIVCNLITTSTS